MLVSCLIRFITNKKIMRQTFLKTINGHTLEFNRLLYPVKYKLLFHSFETPGIIISVSKEEKGSWGINALENLPTWVSESSSNILQAIHENESIPV